MEETIHQSIRLRLMAVLVTLDAGSSLDFTFLRDLLGVTDGNLGGHVHRLEEAGYVEITKTFVDRKPHSYVAATRKGREVFRTHVSALEEILKESSAMEENK